VTRKRLVGLVAAVLLLLAAVDFRQRVYVPREYKARGEGSMVPAAVPAPRAASQIQADLSAWLPQLRPVAASAGSAAQTDWALTLLAVFSDRDNSFAVVRAASSAGGAAKIESVAVGDTLYGLTVSSIEPLRLVLKGERGEQELQLFKPSAASAVGSGRSAQPAVSPDARAAAAPSQAGSPPAQAQVQAPTPGPVTPSQGDTKSTAGQGWKPGAPVQLPASMQGLEIVEAPATPAKAPTVIKKASKVPRGAQAPPPPKNP
jgi:hypothetical protein